MGHLRVDKIDLSVLTRLSTRLPSQAKKAEHAVSIQVAKDTEPYVPALTKSLSNRTQVKGNLVIYPGPYARYLYYGKIMINAKTGKGPALIPNIGLRFPKGAKLKPTDRNLAIKTTVHKNAQSHWFEASKAANLDKWKRVAANGLTKYMNEGK